MMSEKRFTSNKRWIAEGTIVDICDNGKVIMQVFDDDNIQDVVDFLNEQQTTISNLKEENEQLRKYNGQLKERLEKINGGYGHLTHRNGLTANEWLIESQERELKKKNEQISDWIEQHSKDIMKIGKQQTTINKLKEENEQLRKELDNFKPVMFQDMRKGTIRLYAKGGIDE